MTELIAYQGSFFAVEWYYGTKEKSEALHYYKDLSEHRRVKILRLIKLICETGKILDQTKFRNEGDGI